MSLVSVVIPAHNREKYLPGAIDSVLSQTYSDLEVIVVDDGSEDSTPKILGEYSRKDPRVRSIAHSHKKGAQAARNSGIHASRGTWIAFLDSDDQWLPNSLEVRLRQATAHNVDVVYSDFYIHKPDDDAEFRRMGWTAKTSEKLEQACVPPCHGSIYKQVLRHPGPLFQGLLVTKKALARVGYLDESIRSHQEWDTAILLSKYYEFAFVSQPTFIWNCRNEGAMSRNVTGNALGYEQVFTKYRWPILWRLGPKALASHYEAASSLFCTAGDKTQERRCLLWACIWWPFRPSFYFNYARVYVRRLVKMVGTARNPAESRKKTTPIIPLSFKDLH